MAVTTKKLFPATSNATTTVFSPVGIQLNNQDDLDVYVTLSGGTRVLQLRQATGSTADSNHPQVNNTDGLYFPAVSVGTTLYNYQLSTDNNTITFNSALPQGAVVFCERRTRDADSSYTTFASGSTIRATDLNNSATESNFTAQDGRNKALEIEGVLFRGNQPSTSFVTSDHIVAGTIVTGDISNDSVTADKIPDDTIDSEHYVDGSIDTQHIANANITTAKLDNNAVTTVKIADANVTTAKIADSSITTAKLADGAVTDVKLAGGALDARYYTQTLLDNGQLDSRYYTEAESDARYFNVSTGDTIKDGDVFPDNDTTIATTAAINDRIIDLVDDVGGFVPIANETSFPAANPDVNNGSGTLVSIKSISSTRTPSSGTVTITNGAGTGNTVSITGCGSTVLAAGFGVILETTSTLHTYAFHRLVPKATEVTSVAGVSTEISRLGTAAAVEDLSILGTADVVADLAILGTADVVSDLNTLGTAAVVEDLDILGTADVVSDMNTLGTSANVTAMSTCATNIASINNTSANIASANTFGDQYQVASSPPSTDGGGNALAEGDLYFDTTADELKVYNGGAWQGGVTAAGNFASTTGNTFTGSNTYQDNAKAIFGSGQDLEIFHNVNDSIINDAGTGDIKIQTGGSTKLQITSSGAAVTGNLDVSSGVDVTGNITVSGNVDGRDIAADGSSLDSIEQGNIGTDVTNGNVKLQPNGTGVVEVRGAGGNDGTLQLNCSAQSHGIKLKSPPHSAAASYTLTFPDTILNNGFLKTDSSGNLSFAAVNTDLSNDSSPQLGGNLDLNSNDISGTGNISITGGISGNSLTTNAGNVIINSTAPTVSFVDSDANPDYEIKVNGGAFDIRDSTNNSSKFSISAGEVNSQGKFNCQAGLDTDGDVKFNTGTTNVNVLFDASTSTMRFSDSMALSFGDHSTAGDYNISYVNGSDFNIVGQSGGSGDLVLGTYANAAVTKNLVSKRSNNTVELYAGGNKKFETNANGVIVTGVCSATSFTGDGSALSGIAAFPSGTKMLFQQTAAPTGWTKQTSGVDNKALRVVSGTVGSGGSNAFSNTLASKTITANAANASPTGNITVSDTSATGNVSIDSATTGGSVDSHTLSTNEIPAHTHMLRSNSYQNQNSHRSNGPGWNNGLGTTASYRENATNQYRRRNTINMYTEEQGGGGGHTHGFTGGSHNHNGTLSGTAHNHNASFTGSAHNHSITVSNLDLAVQYLDVIIAAKD